MDRETRLFERFYYIDDLNEAITEAYAANLQDSYAIENEHLNSSYIKSSIIKRMNLDLPGWSAPSSDEHERESRAVKMTLALLNTHDLSHEMICNAHGMLEDSYLFGNYRTADEVIVDGSHNVIYNASEPYLVKGQMDDFINWWNDDRNNLPNQIGVAIGHYIFVVIHPFADGNGRIARALSEKGMIMDDSKIFRPYSISSQILKNRGRYYQALGSIIFTRQGRDNLGRFWCRQCGKSGDAIQFLRDIDGIGFKEAKKLLGLPDYLPRNTSHAPKPEKPDFMPVEPVMPCSQWQEKAGKIVEWASNQLDKTPEMLEWLKRERGLNAETIKKARLGWIPEDYYRPREKFGLPPELKDNGKYKRVWIPQGLVIPVFNAANQLMRVKIRVANPGQNRPKYIPIPQAEKNTTPLIFQNTELKTWQIVESELDGVLLMQKAGHIVNVIALGSAVFRPDAETWKRLLDAEKILISLDFDEAGNKNACQWWEKHLKPGQFRLWPVPEGKDPTDAYRAGWDLSNWTDSGLKF